MKIANILAQTQEEKKVRDFKLNIQSNQFDYDGILLCLMTLLHDSTFKFYDGNTAKTIMCFYNEKSSDFDNEDEHKINDGVLALYITYKSFEKTNTFPLFVSNLQISDYFNDTEEVFKNGDFGMESIPWTTAIRENKKLRLVLTE